MNKQQPTSADAPASDVDVRLDVTSDTAHLARVRDAVADAAKRVGFAESAVSQIELAVGEALGNVIKHGYEGRAGQPIELHVQVVDNEKGRGLQVTLCDRGRQVDPGSIVGRELDDVRPGGLGTHIIREVMDEVEYTLREPRGMQLRMLKLIET